MMNTKQKGSVAERELIKLFWDAGWAAFRAAGSGCARYPCPDIIAGNTLRRMGIECKITAGAYQYFTKKEIHDLKGFCDTFGSEAWVAVKFQGIGWFFMSLDDLKPSAQGFALSDTAARNKGFLFEELIEASPL